MMYALKGSASRELITHRYRIILHPNRRELEWLIPNCSVVELTGNSAEEVASTYGCKTMMLRDHPDMASVRWPLQKSDFWANA